MQESRITAPCNLELDLFAKGYCGSQEATDQVSVLTSAGTYSNCSPECTSETAPPQIGLDATNLPGSAILDMPFLSSIEICAGAGGQAFGLERAGFDHQALVEIEPAACQTLRQNRPEWEVIEGDMRDLNGQDYRGVDLVAGGVPCPPFSIAGKQMGSDDDRDLFPAALKLIADACPNAVILENVPGLAKARFAEYRAAVRARLEELGYFVDWQTINASDFGVPQLRPRFILVALKPKYFDNFVWPHRKIVAPTVGDTLYDLMASRGWRGASRWAERANGIAPTLVGGSKLHGGPDLGPTRAKRAWKELAVDGSGLADLAPDPEFPTEGDPKLTVRMAARLQGFPDSWSITGRKTAAYRQVGNALPPPVARFVGFAVRNALLGIASGTKDYESTQLRLG